MRETSHHRLNLQTLFGNWAAAILNDYSSADIIYPNATANRITLEVNHCVKFCVC